jgi:hypothetical protein
MERFVKGEGGLWVSVISVGRLIYVPSDKSETAVNKSGFRSL